MGCFIIQHQTTIHKFSGTSVTRRHDTPLVSQNTFTSTMGIPHFIHLLTTHCTKNPSTCPRDKKKTNHQHNHGASSIEIPHQNGSARGCFAEEVSDLTPANTAMRSLARRRWQGGEKDPISLRGTRLGSLCIPCGICAYAIYIYVALRNATASGPSTTTRSKVTAASRIRQYIHARRACDAVTDIPIHAL